MKSPLTNFRSGPALLAFALTAAVGLGLDLWTKREAFDRLAPWGIERVDEAGSGSGSTPAVLWMTWCCAPMRSGRPTWP